MCLPSMKSQQEETWMFIQTQNTRNLKKCAFSIHEPWQYDIADIAIFSPNLVFRFLLYKVPIE